MTGRAKRLIFPFLPTGLRNWLFAKKANSWKRRGIPSPSPAAEKHEIVKEYGRRFGIRTLVETGTYEGDMVEACRDSFDRIISVELDRRLFKRASRRFESHSHITVLHGDSGRVLGDILSGLSTRCVFWLDAHYSGGMTTRGEVNTPVLREIEAVLKHEVPDHVLLIDDARLFTGENGWPALAEVRKLVARHRPDWPVVIEADVLRIHSPQQRTLVEEAR